MTLLYEWRKAIDAMRKDGYAVIIFTPEELEGADPRMVEKLMKDEIDVPQEKEDE